VEPFGRLLTATSFLLAFTFALIVLAQRKRAPAATVAWILTFFALPYLGVFLYLLLGYRNLARRRRLRRVPKLPVIPDAAGPGVDEERLPDDSVRLARLCERLSGMALEPGNHLDLYEQAEESYAAIEAEIRGAKKHVHLLYYIFQPDEVGRRFRDLLCHKAAEGVECRVLVDHIGSFRLGKTFLAPFAEAGVRFAFFWPVRLNRPWWGFHLRNHRKLVVVDGETGFVGSQNLGNEYVRWKSRRIAWRDTLVRITGPSVNDLQRVFIEDWEFTTDEKLRAPKYFAAPHGHGAQRPHGSLVQVLPTGPDERDLGLELVLQQLLFSARDRVTMLTPYFVPTLSLLLAFGAATRRGVRVDVVVPAHSDQWLVAGVGRAWYPDVLATGANLYQYGHSFLHAKVVTVDDRFVLLGSPNMDERSFRLNFELSLVVHDEAFAKRMVTSFDSIRAGSRSMRRLNAVPRTFTANVRDGALRLLSPLL